MFVVPAGFTVAPSSAMDPPLNSELGRLTLSSEIMVSELYGRMTWRCERYVLCLLEMTAVKIIFFNPLIDQGSTLFIQSVNIFQ